MRRKKPHSADLAAEASMVEAIRNADCFLASLFVGRGIYEKIKAPTVSAAQREAVRLERLLGSTRRCVIYAMDHEGRATFISAALIERLKRAFLDKRQDTAVTIQDEFILRPSSRSKTV
jgi:hypothetical protein